jgi:hypothetical protein
MPGIQFSEHNQSLLMKNEQRMGSYSKRQFLTGTQSRVGPLTQNSYLSKLHLQQLQTAQH